MCIIYHYYKYFYNNYYHHHHHHFLVSSLTRLEDCLDIVSDKLRTNLKTGQFKAIIIMMLHPNWGTPSWVIQSIHAIPLRHERCHWVAVWSWAMRWECRSWPIRAKTPRIPDGIPSSAPPRAHCLRFSIVDARKNGRLGCWTPPPDVGNRHSVDKVTNSQIHNPLREKKA